MSNTIMVDLARKQYRAASDKWEMASRWRDSFGCSIAYAVVNNYPPTPRDMYAFRLFDRMSNMHHVAFVREHQRAAADA